MEYLLVFGVTVALAGFSVAVFSGSIPTLQQTQGQAEVQQVAQAVSLAAQNGTSSLIVQLSDATLSCSNGSVELTTGGATYTSPVSSPCSFNDSGLDGLSKLTFVREYGGINLEVEN
jgi:hypothetical protein